MAVQTTTIESFEAFVNRPENADRLFEFVGGEIVEVPTSSFTSQFGARILGYLFIYLLQHSIGHLTGADGGFMVFGERYAPDVAFMSKARQAELSQETYNPLAPDLAVEVVSPTDQERLLRLKIANYLAAGTVVWAVYPKDQQVEVYEPGKPVRILGIDDTLDGGEMLPGFTLALSAIFAS